jgi:hypothetical protein
MSDFGLSDATNGRNKTDHRALIDSIKPRAEGELKVDVKESDKAAESAGYNSREAKPPVDTSAAFATPRRKKSVPEVMTPLSMRLRRSVHVRFIEFADERNLSYPEALELLLNNSVSKTSSEK